MCLAQLNNYKDSLKVFLLIRNWIGMDGILDVFEVYSYLVYWEELKIDSL